MNNLNQFGKEKTKYFQVNRKLTEKELSYFHISIFPSDINRITKIYEAENGNWNLLLVDDMYFLSIPKDSIIGCKPSVFGDLRHTHKCYNLINL